MQYHHLFHRKRFRFLPSVVLAAALFFAGCRGQKTVGTSAMTISPAEGSTANALPSSPDTSVVKDVTSALSQEPSLVRAMTKDEFTYAVADLLGIPEDPSFTQSWTADPVVSGYESLAWASPNITLADRTGAVEKVAEKAIATGPIAKCFQSQSGQNPWAPCLRKIVTSIAIRAFRRPIKSSEVNQFGVRFNQRYESSVTAASEKMIGHDAITDFIEGILLSPEFQLSFQFRKATPVSATEPLKLLSSFEMAAKLALLFSVSVPDGELMASAAKDELSTPGGRWVQVSRLLQKNIGRFTRNFAGQWLTYKYWDHPAKLDSLEGDFLREMELNLGTIFSTNLPVARFLKPGFSHLNSRLAKNYGEDIASVGMVLKKVDVSDRGGILHLGNVLKATSPKGETSRIARGNFILDHLLCGGWSGAGAVSAEVLGQGLENYDELGRWRQVYKDGHDVVASGQVHSSSFKDSHDLIDLLAQDPQFAKCVVDQLWTYLMGRVPTTIESAQNGEIARDSLKSVGPGVRDIIQKIVMSEAFAARLD